uniref:ZOT protein n=1 Tax=Dulem virus 59 TaxID=3145770 RepID=A0AAU8B9Q0_9VIRU
MISCISGLPGKGKNVYATYIAKKHFKRENSLFKQFIRRLKHEELYVNNVYTTYPIILNKRKKIYSNLVTLNDLNNKYRFKKNALIIIDEVQSFYDSDEFKDFPKSIAVFNQFHRHFDIKDIYYISQHPSRIVKKLRNVSCKFVKIRKFLIIPILNIGIMYITNYYEFDDYGKWHHPSKEMKTYDVDNHFVIFRVSSIFKSYYSKYLSVLNKDKPLYSKGEFKSSVLTQEEIKSIFGTDIWNYRK